MAVLVYILISSVKGQLFPHPLQQLSLVFLVIAIQTDVKPYLIIVLICISLVINDCKHFFTCLCLLLRNVYSDPLHILKISTNLFSCY
jgi:hypothetical protein